MNKTGFQLERFKSLLQGECKNWQLSYVQQTESTNSDLKRFPSQLLTNPFLLIADEQTGGRGQFNRTWKAAAGENLLCSIALKPKKETGLQLLGLLIAVSISEAISEQFPSLKPRIKWPNDVLINQKKIAGILVETQYVAHKPDKIILGFGLNVNQSQFPEELEKTATSLFLESSLVVDKERLLASILSILKVWLELWNDEDPSVLAAIHSKLIGFETYVCLKKTDGTILYPKVWLCGVDMNGHLGILDENEQHKRFEHEQLRVELLQK
jgi:BirA family transcriptional regulator, biotin operon repressor / biotin---[acetyl-CoA-carboxylase] ligase